MNPCGVTTRNQLLAAGVSASTVDYRCRQGIYRRLLPQVYCTGEVTGSARCAAILEWRPDAVLSHRTAAWLHGMLPEPTLYEATMPPGVSLRTPTWLKLYRRRIRPDSITEAWGMAAVEPARALFDCIGVMDKPDADRLVDECLRGRVDRARLLELCELDAALRGSAQVRRQLRAAAVHAASEPERLFARALVERNCPLLPNHPVGPYFGDFVDERAGVVVEVDGREFHSDPVTFSADRRRQNWMLLHGWLVLRYAASEVYRDVGRCADETVAVVRRRRRGRRRRG